MRFVANGLFLTRPWRAWTKRLQDRPGGVRLRKAPGYVHYGQIMLLEQVELRHEVRVAAAGRRVDGVVAPRSRNLMSAPCSHNS